MLAPETNNAVWSETHTYDAAARVVGTATTINEGGSTTFSRTQSYDPATGRPLISTYPSGLAVKTEYTVYGQPSALIKPAMVRSDNSPEFRSEIVQAWARAKGVAWHFIEPGCPAQNAYIERFNGTFSVEVLDANCFLTLADVHAETQRWLPIYNEQRAHQAIGNLPPAVFKRQWQQRRSLFSAGIA